MKKIIAAMLLTGSLVNATNVSEIDRKLSLLTAEVESLKENKSESKVSIGGYGEIVYQDYASSNESGAQTQNKPGAQWDTLRNVIYVGYKFTDKWSFLTEIEIEHAKEIYTEFAEVRYAHSDLLNFKAGLLLAPIGLINEMHEPTRFFGVIRPQIENKIIPTTWRENGFGIYGKLEQLSYKFYIINSLTADKVDGNNDSLPDSTFGASGVRSGRQKGANAFAGNWGYIARADYSFSFGLDLGVSAYVSKTNGLEASGHKHNIYEVHGDYVLDGLNLRFLYVQSDLDGKAISQATAGTVSDRMSGYYVEAGYNLFYGKEYTLAPYVRYEDYNTQDKLDTSVGVASKANDITSLTYGLMYMPIDKISFKADYTKNKNKAKTGEDLVNFGIGWEF